MKKFLVLSAITLCLAGHAFGQYQTAPAYGNGYKQQRKMAPNPQGYGNQQSQQQQSSYGANKMDSMNMMNDNYDQSAINNDDQSAGYMKQQGGMGMSMKQMGGKQTNYGNMAQAAGANSGYGDKQQAAKYEEPQHPPMPFAWGYDINDGYGATQYHKENGDEYGKRTGSYGYMDAYGVYRNVYYVADENGFRATIKTNEPGTANESPADVELTAEEPPANVFMGNKDNSGYGSGSSSGSGSSYDSQSSGNAGQYGGSSAGKQQQQQYGASGASEMNGKQQYGGNAGSSDGQQYGAAMMASRGDSMSQYGKNNAGSGKQQYGAGMSMGMAAMSGGASSKRYGGSSMVANNGPSANGAGQYGASSMAAAGAGSQYGQANGMMAANQYGGASAMMNAGKMSRYGSMSSNGKAKGKQYQGGAMAMMMDAADEMTTQQYGSADAAGATQMQEYGMNMAAPAGPAAAAAGSNGNGYGAGQTDESNQQQYGPSSMMNNAQMQQYGNPIGAQSAPTGLDGTSTYSSTRMAGAAGQSGYGGARSGMGAAKQQAAAGDYEARGTGQMGGYGSKSSQAGSNMDYKKTAKNIASLVKRY